MRKFTPLLIIAAGLLVYRNSFTGPFILDDMTSIPENSTIRRLWPIGPVLSPPQAKGFTVAARPVVNLSLAINYAVGGTTVWGYHAANLATHLLAGLTLYGIVRRTLLRPGLRGRFEASGDLLALSVAVLWVVHPLQTEAVTYIVQRTESLMGLFYLLTLYSFIRGVESPTKGFWFEGSIVVCALGMATKEVMVSAPLMVLLYDRTFVAGSFAEAWKARGRFYAALGCAWIVLGWLVWSEGVRGGSAGFGNGILWWQYALTQCWAIVRYLRLSVWPQGQIFDYGFIVFPRAVEVLPQILILIALLVGTGVALVHRPWLGFLGAWFFLILAPSSSVLPVVTQTVAEHRMYLPLAAVVVLVMVGIQALLGRRTVGAAAGLAIGLGILTSRRNQDYRSALAIWEDTVTKWPENPRAHTNLGLILAQAGKATEAMGEYQQALQVNSDYAEAHNDLGIVLVTLDRMPEAIQQYETALYIDPDYAEAQSNLGGVLEQAGKFPEAIVHFEEALRVNPNLAETHNNLGGALQQTGKLPEAIAQYRQALQIRPDYADAHYNLGVALELAGQREEAILHYQQALRISPGFAAAHYNLGAALARRGRIREAIDHYDQALRIRADYPKVQNNLAWLLATHVDFSNPVRAVTLAQQACRLTNNRVAGYLDTLAAAYAAAGRFDDAVATAQQAAEAARATAQSQLVARIEARLELYRASQAYSEQAAAVNSHDP